MFVVKVSANVDRLVYLDITTLNLEIGNIKDYLDMDITIPFVFALISYVLGIIVGRNWNKYVKE